MLKHYFVEQKKSFNWGKSPSTSRAIEQKILRLPYFSLAYMCGNTKIYLFFTITSGIHKNFIFQGYTLKLLIYKHATTTLTTSDVVEYKRKKGEPFLHFYGSYLNVCYFNFIYLFIEHTIRYVWKNLKLFIQFRWMIYRTIAGNINKKCWIYLLNFISFGYLSMFIESCQTPPYFEPQKMFRNKSSLCR